MTAKQLGQGHHVDREDPVDVLPGRRLPHRGRQGGVHVELRGEPQIAESTPGRSQPQFRRVPGRGHLTGRRGIPPGRGSQLERAAVGADHPESRNGPEPARISALLAISTRYGWGPCNIPATAAEAWIFVLRVVLAWSRSATNSLYLDATGPTSAFPGPGSIPAELPGSWWRPARRAGGVP